MINYLEKYLKYKNKYLKVKNQIGGMIEHTFKVDDIGKTITAYIPDDFLDNIFTLDIMDDPVILSDGHTYERKSIARWLETKNTSPITGAILVNSNMIPNYTLKKIIKDFLNEIYEKKLNKEIGELERLVNSGDCCAQYQLGLKYYSGEGMVVKNLQKALDLLKKSSNSCVSSKKLLQSSNFKESIFEEGKRLYDKKDYSDAAMFWNEAVLLKHHDAHAFLSDMLIDGRLYVPIDKSRAFELASDGVKLGSIHSKGVLGRCYVEGIGVPEDRDKGFRLATESADANSYFGQNTLGLYYLNEYFDTLDDREAFRWFGLAAEQGYTNAQFNLGFIYRYVAHDYEEAMRWYHLAAEQGHASAQCDLGDVFFHGEGVVPDAVEALRWYRLAVAQGFGRAQLQLGRMLEYGARGVEKNKVETLRLYHLAAEQGLPIAQNKLGSIYFFGEDVIKNEEEAMRWWRLAAEKGYPEAQFNLGIRLLNTKDDVEGVRLIIDAANRGEARAQYHLGSMYYFGDGVPQNQEEAVRWCKLAAKQGLPEAQNKLAQLLSKDYSVAQDDV